MVNYVLVAVLLSCDIRSGIFIIEDCFLSLLITMSIFIDFKFHFSSHSTAKSPQTIYVKRKAKIAFDIAWVEDSREKRRKFPLESRKGSPNEIFDLP